MQHSSLIVRTPHATPADLSMYHGHAQVRVVIPPAAGSSQREPGYVMAQIREVITREPGTYRSAPCPGKLPSGDLSRGRQCHGHLIRMLAQACEGGFCTLT